MSEKEKKKKSSKKPYQAPKLKEYGSVRQFTRTGTYGMMTDGGTGTMTMRNCVGPVSYLEEHGTLLADRAMQGLFRDAIFRTVRHGDVVLDLGTGTGIHAMFACQAGASRVYAIDSEPIIELAGAVAEENGFESQVTLIRGEAAEVELPEQVDVIITNTGFVGTMECLPDAVQRFLRPGGRLIPQRIELSFVPVEATAHHRDSIDSWDDEVFGLTFRSIRPYAASKPSVSHFTHSEFLSTPRGGCLIELSSALPEKREWQVSFEASRVGTCTGIAGWYSFHLCDGVTLSLDPPLEISPDIWRHIYLPLAEPIRVTQGQKLCVTVELYPGSNPAEPFWRWHIETSGSAVTQSSFDAVVLSDPLLRKLIPQ